MKHKYYIPVLSIVLCAILSLTSLFLYGQEGYQRWYDFGNGTFFRNMILDDNTLVISGSIFNEDRSQLDAMLLRMDTLGEVISLSVYSDSLGSSFGFYDEYPLIKNSDDQGYVMAFDVLSQSKTGLLTWSQNGELQSYLEIPDVEGEKASFPQELVSIGDDFLLFSTRQLENFETSIFVTRLNSSGEKIWERRLGEYDRSETLVSLWEESPNEYVLGAVAGTEERVDPQYPYQCGASWILAVDSLGEMLWEWMSEPCESYGINGLHRTEDGGWIYSTSTIEVFALSNFGWAPVIAKRDSEFNLEWSHQLAESYSQFNYIGKVISTSDGNWVFSGAWVHPLPYNSLLGLTHIYKPASLFKFSEDGDILWSRWDTVALDNQTYEHNYAGVVSLPSGSIIGAGHFEEQIPFEPTRYYGLLVKVNKDGCIDSEDCLTTSTTELGRGSPAELEVFPNPASEYLDIRSSERIHGVRLLSSQGKQMQSRVLDAREGRLWIGDTPSGIYLLEVSYKDHQVVKMVMVE